MAKNSNKIASSADKPIVETVTEHTARKPVGGSTAQWRQWAKEKPNRAERAKATIKEMNEAEEAEEAIPTTNTRTNTKARKAAVAKWQKSRPESGAHKATTKEGAEQRRANMIEWAQWNPNKRSNANRAAKKK
jgi:hypothetical protein